MIKVLGNILVVLVTFFFLFYLWACLYDYYSITKQPTEYIGVYNIYPESDSWHLKSVLNYKIWTIICAVFSISIVGLNIRYFLSKKKIYKRTVIIVDIVLLLLIILQYYKWITKEW